MAYEFKIICFLFVFVLGSIAIEIRTSNAIKSVHILSLLRNYCLRELRCDFLTLVLDKWWAKLVIQELVEYQVPNFEMAISFKLRLEKFEIVYTLKR